MRIFGKIFCVLGCLSSIGLAQEETGKSRFHVTPFNNVVKSGWTAYLDISAGYAGYNRNLDVEGAPSAIKILGSYVVPDAIAVFDMGYGVQNQTFSQKAAIDTDISTSVMELAVRHPFDNHLQLGAVYNQFFNRGENYGASQADAEFLGVQLLREFGLDANVRSRVGMRLMTSVNVVNESVNMAFIDFQLGWGGSSRNPDVVSR